MNRVNNSAYNNDWFKRTIGAGLLKQLIWYFINVLFLMNPLNPFSGLKVFFLRAFGAKIGKGVVIKPGVNIKYPWKLVIGDFSWIGEKVWIDNLVDVVIGDNVCISQSAMLLTGNHNYKKMGFDLIVKGITIENGAWVCAKALVCPGTHLCSHSILTVGSVANLVLEPYTIYSGNPAKPIRKRVIE